MKCAVVTMCDSSVRYVERSTAISNHAGVLGSKNEIHHTGLPARVPSPSTCASAVLTHGGVGCVRGVCRDSTHLVEPGARSQRLSPTTTPPQPFTTWYATRFGPSMRQTLVTECVASDASRSLNVSDWSDRHVALARRTSAVPSRGGHGDGKRTAHAVAPTRSSTVRGAPSRVTR